MSRRRTSGWALLAGLLLGLAPAARAGTAGQVTVTFGTKEMAAAQFPGQLYIAIWVSDAQDRFVKTLTCRATQTTTRRQHLIVWAPASAQNLVDAVTGATVMSHYTHTATWDCTDTSRVVVPDGVYRIRAEFTQCNSFNTALQPPGPVTPANYVEFTKGPASVQFTQPDLTYFTNISLRFVPAGPDTERPTTPRNLRAAVRSSGRLDLTWNASTDNASVVRYDVSRDGSNLVAVVANAFTDRGLEPGSTHVYSVEAVDSSGNRSIPAVPLAATTLAATPSVAHWDFNEAAGTTVLDRSGNGQAGTLTGATRLSGLLDGALSFDGVGSYVTVADAPRLNPREELTIALWMRPTNVGLGGICVAKGAAGASYHLRPFASTIRFSLGTGSTITQYEPSFTCTNATWYHVAATYDGAAMRLYINGTQIGTPTNKTGTIYATDGTGLSLGRRTTGNYFAGALDDVRIYDRALAAAEIRAIRALRRDLVVTGASAPPSIAPGGAGDLSVAVWNRGAYEESFAVTVSNAAATVGTRAVTRLAADSLTNVLVRWDTAALPPDFYALSASAGPVAGETNRQDNAAGLTACVAAGVATNILVPRASTWRYSDAGLNLDAAPWRDATYYDGFWASGAGPLGYGNTGDATVLGYGAVATNKPSCCYFRRTFYTDFRPVSLALRARRDDGIIVHLNGAEQARDFMPPGAPAYATRPHAAANGSEETNYLALAVAPSAVVPGRNVVAAEVHQERPDGDDLGFDLELVAVTPLFPRNPDAAAVTVSTVAEATAGDVESVAVKVANEGNIPATLTVTLRDVTAAKTIGTKTVDNLLPSRSSVLRFDWNTLGAAAGTHRVEADVAALPGEADAADNIAGADVLMRTPVYAAQTPGAAASMGGRSAAVAVSGSYAYVGEGATLSVLNIAVPATPARVGGVRLPGNIESLTLSGFGLLAACGPAGVQVIDVTSPAAPVHTNTIPSAGFAYDTAAVGTLLGIADGSGGLRLVDMANRKAPRLVGTYRTDGPARSVLFSVPNAFVLDWHNGLKVVNIANPAAPALVGSFAGLAFAQEMALKAPLLYVAEATGRLTILNVGTPASPSRQGSLALPAANAVAVAGTTAYVAAGESGLAIVNAATPAAPALLTLFDTPGQAANLAAVSTTVYVADGFEGLRIVDAAAPATPVVRGFSAAGFRAGRVAVRDGLACVAAGEAGLEVYAVTNPAAPVRMSLYAGAAPAVDVALAPPLACVAAGRSGLRLLDVSDPAHVVPLASCTNAAPGYLYRVVTDGARTVVTDGHRVQRIDTSAPTQPVLRDAFDSPAFVLDLAMGGPTLVAAAGGFGLLVFDLSGPSGLALRSRLPLAGPAQSVAMAGTTVYVSGGWGGWGTVDVSQPDAPRLTRWEPTARPALHIAQSGALAQVSDGGEMRVLTVGAPISPVPDHAIRPLALAMQLAAAGRYTYAAEQDAGLAVLDASPLDHDLDGLLDAWEQTIVDADPGDAITDIAQVLPDDDFDGDGLSNIHEWLAGTNPTDPASIFALRSLPTPDAGAGTVITWPSTAGRTYTLYASTNLLDGFTTLAPGLPASPPLNTYTDTVTRADAAFYMVGVSE